MAACLGMVCGVGIMCKRVVHEQGWQWLMGMISSWCIRSAAQQHTCTLQGGNVVSRGVAAHRLLVKVVALGHRATTGSDGAAGDVVVRPLWGVPALSTPTKFCEVCMRS